MKRKIVMITAMLAVMVVLTGIAMAEDFGIEVSENIKVKILDTGTQLVTVNATGGVRSLTINGILYNGLSPAYDIGTKFTTKIDGVVGITYGPVDYDINPFSKTFLVTFENNLGAPNGDYTIEYVATRYTGPSMTATRTLTAQSDIIAIPEFPAVALPVAAVIGLVFVFQHRKQKEE